MRESRLARGSIKQSKNQLYASIVGIVVLLFIAINFGPFIIGGLGGVIDKLTGKGNQTDTIAISKDIQAPNLDPIPDATPSARINVTGRAYYPNGTVELYVNDQKADETTLDNSQDFKFESVKLSDGNNSIKVRMIINTQTSDFSDTEQIMYSKNAPKLDISFPSDQQSFHKGDQQITVTGTTDPDNSVSVNGFVAIVDGSGNFSYNLSLSNGDNKLTIVATSQSGQTTSKDITVSYSE